MELIKTVTEIRYGYAFWKEGEIRSTKLSVSYEGEVLRKHKWAPEGLIERYIGEEPLIQGAAKSPEEVGERVCRVLTYAQYARMRKQVGLLVPLVWQTREIERCLSCYLFRWRQKFPPEKEEIPIVWGLFVGSPSSEEETTIKVVALWYKTLPNWKEWGKAIIENVGPALKAEDKAKAFRLIREGMDV